MKKHFSFKNNFFFTIDASFLNLLKPEFKNVNWGEIFFITITVKSIKSYYFFLMLLYFKNFFYKIKPVFFNKMMFNHVLLFSIFFSYINFFYTNVMFYKFINKYVITLCLVYFLVSGFVFLNKSYSFGKYTSQIQRFWKRSYILFWVIEIFLFIFFSYLFLVHFSESTYFLDLRPLMYSSYVISNYWLSNTLLIVFCIYLNYSILFFLKRNDTVFVYLSMFIINIIMLIVFYNEFYRFLYVINYYYSNYRSLKYYYESGLLIDLSCSDVINKTRTFYHYSALVIFLKFWHTLLIYLYYIFICNKVKNREISYDIISSNIQNLIFYIFFNFIFIIFFFKNIAIFYFNEIYYWFYISSEFKHYIYVFYEIKNIFLF